jgi:hypothetical protein
MTSLKTVFRLYLEYRDFYVFLRKWKRVHENKGVQEKVKSNFMMYGIVIYSWLFIANMAEILKKLL